MAVLLNFKMATPPFFEAINAIEENLIMKRIKDSNEFGFWKSKI